MRPARIYDDFQAIFSGKTRKQVQAHIRSIAECNKACADAVEYAIRKCASEKRKYAHCEHQEWKDIYADPAMYAWMILYFANDALEKIGSSHYIEIPMEA